MIGMMLGEEPAEHGGCTIRRGMTKRSRHEKSCGPTRRATGKTKTEPNDIFSRDEKGRSHKDVRCLKE